jgi:hypothetical protein
MSNFLDDISITIVPLIIVGIRLRPATVYLLRMSVKLKMIRIDYVDIVLGVDVIEGFK